MLSPFHKIAFQNKIKTYITHNKQTPIHISMLFSKNKILSNNVKVYLALLKKFSKSRQLNYLISSYQPSSTNSLCQHLLNCPTTAGTHNVVIVIGRFAPLAGETTLVHLPQDEIRFLTAEIIVNLCRQTYDPRKITKKSFAQ